MTNHTPAPWDVDEYGDILSERNGEISIVATVYNDEIEINKADRRLILAAPDMYEALESAKALMDVRNDYGVVYDRICDALKKSRGE